MLREFPDLSQEKAGYRRLFVDDYFDLYLWYDKEGGRLVGFQLCYDKEDDEHSLTWLEGKGYLHSRIDHGEPYPAHTKQSPVLMPDGFFDKKGIAERFKEAGENLPPGVADLVCARILDFSPDKINPLL